MRRASWRTEGPGPRPRPGPGDRLVAAGVTVFAVGLVATLVTVVPFFFGAHDRPLALNLLALLMPVGLGLALIGLLRAARGSPRRRPAPDLRRCGSRRRPPARRS